MHRGYVKSWRKTEDSMVWRMPPLYHRVWTWLLWKANHKGCRVSMGKTGIVIVKTGQVLTSMDKIAEGVSHYQRHVKKKPNKKTIRVILKWFESQGMIVIEKTVLTMNSQSPHEQRLKSNGSFTLITIANWPTYQGRLGDESNDESNGKVTVAGHKQECKKIIKNISCGKLEDLNGLLISLPDFCEQSEKTQKLIISFLDKARLENKTQTISSRRVQTILNELIALCGETCAECLCAALEVTLERAADKKFSFNKQNVTGYVKAIARNRFQQMQKSMNEKYEPQETDTNALYGQIPDVEDSLPKVLDIDF